MYQTTNAQYGIFTRQQRREMEAQTQKFQSRVPKIGLLNIGNTCYIFKSNTILQCLFNTPEVQSYLLTLNPQNIKAQERTADFFSAFYAIWQKLYQVGIEADEEEIHRFKHALGRRYQPFDNTLQQDCNEFFLILLDQTNLDLRNFDQQNNSIQNGKNFQSMKIKADFQFTQYINKELSPISKIFTGQLIHKLECQSCKSSDYNFEYFHHLSLNLSLAQSQQTIKIWYLLQEYFKTEELQAICPKCNKKARIIRKTSIINLPNVLVIQLKRFNYFQDKQSKVQQQVCIEQAINIQSLSDLIEPKQCNYSLYGVVNHEGVIYHGHYTCLIKDQLKNCWVHFNDIRVSEYGDQYVQNELNQSIYSYVLFYSKI